MTHPLAHLTPKARARLFWLMLVANLLLPLGMSGPYSAESPYGIVSLELAGTVARAEAIVASWDEAARIHAAFGIGLDYLFMLTYSTAMALACLWAAERWKATQPALARLGQLLAWGQGLAALLDGIENVALLRLLYEVSPPWPQLAAACATLKFTLIGIGLGYTLTGLLARRVRHERP